MWKNLMVLMIVLSACGKTVGSSDAFCAEPVPRFSLETFQSMTPKEQTDLDVFAEKHSRFCEK